MSRRSHTSAAAALYLAAALLLMAAPAAAQFDSGSSGVHGSFPPYPTGTTALPSGARYLLWNLGTGFVRYCSVYDMTARLETCTTEVGTAQIQSIPTDGLKTGVYEFTNVDVTPVTPFYELYIVPFPDAYNSPLSILSKSAIRFGNSVYLYANGHSGQSTASGLQPSVSLPGGPPGPGGFAGGASGFAGSTATNGSPGFGPTGGGMGTAGTAGGSCYGAAPWLAGASAGVSPTSTTLSQLIGGSGGGGAASTTTCGIGHNNGGSGGGGGGAVLMAATTEINFGSGVFLSVTGGDGGSSYCSCFEGGAGAGGSVKLVAPRLVSPYSYVYLYGGYHPYTGGSGGGGSVRVEGDALQFNFGIYGQSSGSVTATPGALSPAATPSLRIVSVGGQAVPPAPTGNTATPDVNFSQPPSGPVDVLLAAVNIPDGVSVKVRVTPQVGAFAEYTSSALSSGAASAAVTIPAGFGSITATTTFACNGTICALLPPRDQIGAHVEVVASAAGSRAFIVTSEGRRLALGN